MSSQRPFWRRVMRKLRTQFIAGLLAFVPPVATLLILIWVFIRIDNILQPIIKTIAGHPIPGVGFGITILLIYLTGVIASNVFGRKLIHYGESVLPVMPLVRPLYHSIKQILESFSEPGQTGYMQVVFVEFPRKGMKALGFITNETTDEAGEKLVHIFVPTSPNPTSGFLEIVREEEITRTKISVENALQMIVSAGRVIPGQVRAKLHADKE